MVIKRDSLRAKRDFFSPMQGDRTEIRYSAAPERRNTLTSEVKRRLADIGSNTRRAAPVIEAIKTEMKKTADPFTKVEEQKSYAPQQDRGFADVLGQAAGAASAVGSAIGSGVDQVTQAVSAAGSKVAENRAEQAAQRAAERAAEKAELDKRFSGIETGLSNLGSDYKQQELAAIDRYNQFRDQLSSQDQRFNAFSLSQLQRDIQQDIATRKAAQDAKTYEQNRLKEGEKFANRLSGIEQQQTNFSGRLQENERGQYAFADRLTGLSNQFGSFSAEQLKRNIQQDIAIRKAAQDAKTYEQNRLKEGEKFANRLSGIEQQQTNFSGKLQENERGQYAFADRLTGVEKAINASTFQQANVRGSAFNTGKDESERPKQTVAALPSDYKETEAKAFLDAKAYQALKDSGLDKTVSGEDAQVNVGSGSLGSFGLGTAGKGAPSGAALPAGSFGSGSRQTIESSPTSKVDTDISRHSPGTSADQPEKSTGKKVTYRDPVTGQKTSVRPPGQTVASLPSNYSATEREAFKKAAQFKAEQAAVDKRSQELAKATGIPSGTDLKEGSFGISQAAKDQAAINRGVKAAEATGIPSGADLKEGSFGISAAGKAQAEANRTEAVKKAQAAAAQETPAPKFDAKQYLANYKDLRDAFGDDLAKAEQHYKEYGIKEGRTTEAVEGGVADFDADQYLANYADLRETFGDDKAAALKHYKQYGIKEGRSDASSIQRRNEARKIADRNPNVSINAQGQAVAANDSAVARAQAMALNRKLSGQTISQVKAANKASMKAAAAARNASFQERKKAGELSRSERTASGQRAAKRAAAKQRAKNAAKARNKRKKCDIRSKHDISKLTNINILRDDLADVAYFVKELQESN